jgi:uncharacterized protein YfkK (UPF0435 family)
MAPGIGSVSESVTYPQDGEEKRQLKEAVEQPRLMQITKRLEMNNQELEEFLLQIMTKLNMIDYGLLRDEKVVDRPAIKEDDITTFSTTVFSQLETYTHLVAKVGSIERALKKLVG